LVQAPVQSDKTKETMVELKKELADIITTRPATQDELFKVQSSLTLQMPGNWESMSAVAGSISSLVNYNLPDDYYNTYPQKIKSMTLTDISDVAKRTLQPQNLIWVIIGDRAKIEAGIRELGYGDVKLIDSDGNLVK
jgi:zinc protease